MIFRRPQVRDQVCHTVGIGRRTLFSYLAQVKNRRLLTPQDKHIQRV